MKVFSELYKISRIRREFHNLNKYIVKCQIDIKTTIFPKGQFT